MFAKNCRICLSDQSDNVTHLFTTEQNDGKSPSEAGQMYLDCLQLELVDKQGYPNHICNYCKLQLSVFHNFMMMAKRSYDKFKNESKPVIKSEKIYPVEPDLEDFNEPYNPDLDVQKSVLNSEAEYLDLELDEDTGFEVSGIGDTIFNNLTEDDNMDDCVVEYLDDDEVILTNIKNEVIEVKDDAGDDTEELDDLTSNNCDYNIGGIVEPSSKIPILTAFFDAQTAEECLKVGIPPQSRLDCKICGKKFKTLVMYQSHMNVHNGLAAFKCEMCDKTFNFRSNYQSHILLHTNERPYPCDLCDKGFRSKWDLIIHTRVHNDIRKYGCKICGKRFRVSSHLTSHQYTHAEEKLFECDLCHQRYNSPRTLKQHKNTVHSSTYRFYCSQCDKKFKRKHHVISHLKTHNKNQNSENMNENKNGVVIEYELEYRDEF